MTNASMNACCSDHNSVPALSAATEPRTGLLTRQLEGAKRLMKWIEQARTVHSQRQALLKMSDDQLNDIGLARVAAEREAGRAFWDFTQH